MNKEIKSEMARVTLESTSSPSDVEAETPSGSLPTVGISRFFSSLPFFLISFLTRKRGEDGK